MRPSHDAPSVPSAPAPSARGVWLGYGLVVAQFGLIGVLAGAALTAPLQRPVGPWAWLAALLAIVGGALGLAAVAANRPSNFRIHPAPHAHGVLVTHGPYRLIRHPMYAAVLLLGAAAAVWSGEPWAAALWPMLLAVLLVKAQLEERWMRARHPAYAGYCRRTWRLLPPLF